MKRKDKNGNIVRLNIKLIFQSNGPTLSEILEKGYLEAIKG